ncbi:MAG TPA: cupin-like domain-containing protein [Alloacidobacterium sp.]|nr:cupin-like domain-containing protein [Alloacidobacterium sp.]
MDVATLPVPCSNLVSMKVVPIERRSASGLSYRDYTEDYVIKNRPVIITDAIEGWSALRTWTPDFFRKQHGSKIVRVSDTVTMTFADLIDAVEASTPEKPGPYLHKVFPHRDMPELLKDLQPEVPFTFPCRYSSALMPQRLRRPDGYLKLLIGGVGAKFPVMHWDNDNANALITELYGLKEFVLFSPNQTPFIYPQPGSPHTSQLSDLENPDLNKFPLFVKATQYRDVLKPGEMILIPAGWWHSTRMLSVSISICCNSLHPANWRGFVDDACTSGKHSLQTWMKRSYLTGLGGVLSAAETIQERFPKSGISRRLHAVAPLGSGTLS